MYDHPEPYFGEEDQGTSAIPKPEPPSFPPPLFSQPTPITDLPGGVACVEYLPVTLTPERMRELSEQESAAVQGEEDSRMRVKDFAEKEKALQKEHHGTALTCARAILDGYEMIGYECKKFLSVRNQQAIWKRVDTGEVIKERALNAEDRKQLASPKPPRGAS